MSPSEPAADPKKNATCQATAGAARIFWILAVPFLALKAALLIVFTLTSRYVMDELMQASYSLFIPAGFYRGFHDTKTVLYVYYYDLARLLTHDSVHLMRVARLESFLLAVGMNFFVFRTARNLGFDRLASTLAVAVLVSFSTFMEQSFLVRSDVCAVFFTSATLWWATRPRSSDKARDLVSGALAALAFLCTQKAAYVVLALGVGLLASRAGRGLAFLRAAFLGAAGFWLTLGAYAVFFGGFHFAAVVREVFLAPLRTPGIHGQELYPGMRRYLWTMLERNALPIAICVAGIVIAATRWRTLRSNERFALAFTVVVSAAYFSYEQPWPYVLLWPLPALAVASPYAAEAFPRPGGRTAPLVAAVLLLAFSFPRNFRYLALSNHEQEESMAVAESLLRPDQRYADGLWMLPTRFHAGLQWWDAFNLNRIIGALNRGDFHDIREIFEAQPKIWITNYRVRALWPALRPLVERSYVPVYPGVLLTGAMLPGPFPVVFRNWWSGSYSLYDSSGRRVEAPLTVNGRGSRGPVDLGAGRFEISSSAAARRPLFLLPSDARLLESLPAPVWDRDLFAGVYDF